MNDCAVISRTLNMDGRLQNALRSLQRANNVPRGQRPDFAMIQIARLALSIEADFASFQDWFRSSPIREFEGLTAQQLVDRGESRLVIDFLWSIRRNERG